MAWAELDFRYLTGLNHDSATPKQIPKQNLLLLLTAVHF